MSYWPFTMRRDTKKDEQITELQGKETALKHALEDLKKTIEAQDKRITEIALLHEKDVAEYVETIKELQDEYSKRIAALEHALPADVLAFFRSLHKGDFRSNRNGPARFDEAQNLLEKYDKPVLSN